MYGFFMKKTIVINIIIKKIIEKPHKTTTVWGKKWEKTIITVKNYY